MTPTRPDVEAPAGVGFSFSDDSNDYTVGDYRTAHDNYKAIQQFLIRFPNLQTNDLYISAESYGGHYVPTLAQVIVQDGGLASTFKGFLLGNPLTDVDENAISIANSNEDVDVDGELRVLKKKSQKTV